MTTKKARRFALILCATLLFSTMLFMMPSAALAAEGDTGTTGIWLWKELADGTLEIVTCTTPAGSLTLPDKLDIDPAGTVDEREVTSIGNGAFGMASGITAISLPSTLTSIGENAFISCTGLQSITIPAGVVTIGDYAFASCSSLETVTMQDGLKTLGASAFSGCASLTTVAVPDTVTGIGAAAFSSCTNLESITLPSNPAFTELAENLFINCGRLESIAIPTTVTAIHDNAFVETNLTSITIPANVSFLGEMVFAACPNLAAFQVDPANAHFLSDGGVLYSKDKTNLIACPIPTTGVFTVPASVTDLSAGAFIYCQYLTRIELPDNLQTIGMVAFGYTGITDITIPKNVTSLGIGAFMGCQDLTKAVFLCPAATLDLNVFLQSGIDDDGIYGFAGSTIQTYATENNHPFHTLVTVSFDSGEGSTVGDVYAETGHTFTAPADPTCTGYVFTGWYADEALTDPWDFDTDTLTGDMELYAGWAPVLAFATTPASSLIYVGGRITITPSISGGTWDFDEALLSREGNTFTGLKAGAARITYTAGAQSAHADITIREAELPATGQDFSAALWLLVLAALACGAAVLRFKLKACNSGQS